MHILFNKQKRVKPFVQLCLNLSAGYLPRLDCRYVITTSPCTPPPLFIDVYRFVSQHLKVQPKNSLLLCWYTHPMFRTSGAYQDSEGVCIHGDTQKYVGPPYCRAETSVMVSMPTAQTDGRTDGRTPDRYCKLSARRG